MISYILLLIVRYKILSLWGWPGTFNVATFLYEGALIISGTGAVICTVVVVDNNTSITWESVYKFHSAG
jgi:hypothetical protein